MSTKLSWSLDGDLVVAGGFYDIFMGKLMGHDGSVAVKYPTMYDQGLGVSHDPTPKD